MEDNYDLRLYNLLNDQSYYSLEVNYVSKLTNVPVILLTSDELSSYFKFKYDDKINTFMYNSVTYIGLESRRVAYERDKLAGVNWVEDAIKRGLY